MADQPLWALVGEHSLPPPMQLLGVVFDSRQSSANRPAGGNLYVVESSRL